MNYETSISDARLTDRSPQVSRRLARKSEEGNYEL